MSKGSMLFKELKEQKQEAMSSRKRLYVFLLAILLPIGIHELYLGRAIKFFGHTGYLILFSLGPFFIFMQFAYAMYLAYIVTEASYYLLSSKAKDGDGFYLKPLGIMNRISSPRKVAILLAFLVPVGIHSYILDKSDKATLVNLAFFFILFFYLTAVVLSDFMPLVFFIRLDVVFIAIIICWIDGVRLVFKKSY